MTATLNDELHRAVDVAGTAQSRRPPAASCTLGAILTDLDEQTRAGVLDALNLPARSGGKSDEALAAILTRHGRPVHWQTVRRHRVGACACPTPATARDAA